MADFTDLVVWQRAQALMVRVYAATERVDARRFPGMTSQLRRAAAAIGTNIAEGSAQATGAQFARYLTIAIGSAAEVQHHLDSAHRVGMLSSALSRELATETLAIRRMTVALRRHVLRRARDARAT